MPVAAIEAYTRGQTIEACLAETETHAAEQYGGKTYVLAALPIDERYGFIRTHLISSFPVMPILSNTAHALAFDRPEIELAMIGRGRKVRLFKWYTGVMQEEFVANPSRPLRNARSTSTASAQTSASWSRMKRQRRSAR